MLNGLTRTATATDESSPPPSSVIRDSRTGDTKSLLPGTPGGVAAIRRSVTPPPTRTLGSSYLVETHPVPCSAFPGRRSCPVSPSLAPADCGRPWLVPAAGTCGSILLALAPGTAALIPPTDPPYRQRLARGMDIVSSSPPSRPGDHCYSSTYT